MNKILIILVLCLAAGFACAQNEPYALGADISKIQQDEKSTKYYRNGQAKDLFIILKESGFNYIRLRLFVDPTAKVTEDKPNSDGWSASPYSTAGYCGLDSTIKVAKRIKEAGMKFLLDFHYSDTWADPGKQYKPMSWRNINFTQLTEKVRAYTKESLQAFKNAGVLPDMVQVGNEVVGGMIHPDGQGNTQNFATLVNAGIMGVRDVDANIKIMMHTITRHNNTDPDSWLATLKSNLNKVEANAANKIDVIGLSYYPMWHGDLNNLSRVLTALANKNNIKIAVVEYADFHREVNDLVHNLPDNKGFGTFVWEPQWFDGDTSKPLFDWKNNPAGRHSNARLELYPQMVIDYGLSNVQSSSSSSLASSSSRASSSSARSSSSLASSSSRVSSSSSADEPSSSSNIESSSSSEDITPVLSANPVKNVESLSIYFDGSRVLIKKTLSNGKARIFDLKGKER
ncbi:MAG: arabinogalactan endo-1,4-beta-galactosidase [Fibromonadaceae bacterium]|jgi:arabinogalactan endo-1,4-beta-galactosidase|nr:arabinogalactan endo-1,4-beta-galactosidase [Fibromonadaceae bacterium]